MRVRLKGDPTAVVVPSTLDYIPFIIFLTKRDFIFLLS
jgi:hypothetical protein